MFKIELFLNEFFSENIIICIFNNAEKIWIFLVRVKSFIHLNDSKVLNDSCINNALLVAITPNQAILCDVQYLATCLYGSMIFLLLL